MTRQTNIEGMPANPTKLTGSFFLVWIILTSLGVPIAFLLSIIVLKTITNIVGDFVYVDGVQHITEDYLMMYVFIPIVSLVTGALQYGLLRRFLPRLGWWVPATVAGWLLGVLLISLPSWLGWMDSPPNNLDLILLTMGFAIGLTQWLVLRRRLSRAGWWIIANILGWALLGLITRKNSLDQYGLFALGLLPACTTAVMLALHLNRVPSTEPRQ